MLLSNILTFAYDSVESLHYEKDGHYHLSIPTFYHPTTRSKTPDLSREIKSGYVMHGLI